MTVGICLCGIFVWAFVRLPFKSTVEVHFLNAVEHRLRVPLDVGHCFKTFSPQFFIFNLGNKVKSQGGLNPVSREDGNDNHVVVSHKVCGFQGCVGSCVFMMKEPVVVSPKFGLFCCTFSLEHLKMSQ
jgi:hypothetical protein